MNEAQQFFFDNAGCGYRPDKESEFVGRVLGAIALARAEAWAADSGVAYDWSISDVDSSEHSDEPERYELFDCLLLLPCAECAPLVSGHEYRAIDDCPRKLYTHIHASLGAIDFGPGAYPDGAYKRVIEAELALEAMPS